MRLTPSWYEHWKENCERDGVASNFSAGERFVVRNSEGVMSRLEVVCVWLDKNREKAKNRVVLRYVGSKQEFEYSEEALHKHLVSWQ